MPSRFVDPDSQPLVRALNDFPASFSLLKKVYSGFSPAYEIHRESMSSWLGELLTRMGIEKLDKPIVLRAQRDVSEFIQRHFYWSAACFIRSYELFLSFLTLSRRGHRTWSYVTGYYSRLYTAKGICNLCLGGWVNTATANGKRQELLAYISKDGPRLLPARATKLAGGSHQKWWGLFAQLQFVTDWPKSPSLDFALIDETFSSDERNQRNYSDEWLHGFPELEWFDTELTQMLSHMGWGSPRHDQDFTNMDRYFEGLHPEYCDPADFYTDPVQSLWASQLAYLDLLKALRIDQEFLTAKKLIAISSLALSDDYPLVLAGLEQELKLVLQGK